VSKKTEDHIQDEVRRRLAAHHAAAGVPSQQIALEVLFLLPSEFVRAYSELFWKALGDPISPQGDGGKDEGRVKARGISNSPMNTRKMRGAQSGGKRFVARVWPVRSEEAVKAKNNLDKRLIRAVEDAHKTLRTAQDRSGQVDDEAAGAVKQCQSCGVLQNRTWLRCPFHPE
jgi:hypothetical protein